MKTGLMRIARRRPESFTDRDRENFRHRRRCLCARCNNPGKKPGGRHAVQKALLWAGRNRNISQVYPVPEPNGSRNPLDRSSLPDGNSYNVLGSNNHVPERTSDPQR
jgi:hypothetical protein